MRGSVMHMFCNSGFNIFGVLPLCYFFYFNNNSCVTYTIEMELYKWIDLDERKCHA